MAYKFPAGEKFGWIDPFLREYLQRNKGAPKAS